MLSFEQALEKLLAAAQPVEEVRSLPLTAAAGRILALAQQLTVAVPPLDNSAMDGYAVRTADVTAAGVCLPVSQRIPAGTVGTTLQPGTAARIFTGAPVPAGADAVIMQELCEHGENGVVINHVPRPEENIRRAGEDIAVGADILKPGIKLRPQDIALAASAGLPELPVYRRVRVGVFFTGDELVQPGEPLPPGAIYNSNRYALRALLEGMGCEVRDLGTVPDNLDATRDALRRAAADNDLIITSGGVSVGEEDHVKPAVEAEGRLDMWKIAIKPGKPLAFGEVAQGRWQGLVHRPAGQPGVGDGHLHDHGSSLRAAPAGRQRRDAARLRPARRFRLAAAGRARRIPARPDQRTGRRRALPQPGLRRRHLAVLGRRPRHEPAGAGRQAGRPRALRAFCGAAVVSVKVLYFASLKEALGMGSETVELPAGVTTVGSLRDWLASQGRDKLASARNLRCAVNQDMANADAAVRDGDEIAFFPPVTGG